MILMQNKCNFTEEQVKEFYNLYLGGLSCTKIAKQKGTTVSTICNYFKKYNLKVENRQNKINIDIDKLIEDYNNCKSLTKVAKKYGSTTKLVGKLLRQCGINPINEQNKLRFNENVFDSIDTEEKAYWLGFIFADGYISKQVDGKKNQYCFELALAECDKKHLDKFNNFIEYNGDNVKYKPIKYNGNINGSYRWSVHNKHLWETLNLYGCTPKKSLTLKFPNKAIFKTNNLILSFIRGYFDGDGCITVIHKHNDHPQCEILGTIDVLKSIQYETLNDSDCVSFHNNSKRNNITKSYIVGGVKALAFLYMLYYKSNIYLDRKYQLFLHFKDCRFKAKALKLLEGKIGEGWDANPELIADIKILQQCNA